MKKEIVAALIGFGGALVGGLVGAIPSCAAVHHDVQLHEEDVAESGAVSIEILRERLSAAKTNLDEARNQKGPDFELAAVWLRAAEGRLLSSDWEEKLYRAKRSNLLDDSQVKKAIAAFEEISRLAPITIWTKYERPGQEDGFHVVCDNLSAQLDALGAALTAK